MASGGKRTGAGRPKGSQNKTTKARREAAQKAAEAEVTPLDVLTAGMRHHYDKWCGAKAKDLDDLTAACEFAAKAAPYVHPRLASTDSNINHTVNGLKDMLEAASGKTGTFDDWRRATKRSDMAPEQPVHNNGQGRA